ncbi:MAG: hypothetical protein NZ658_08915, partial [Pirellulales bacterium]|nr:hypothetical protein [Pirellulales bacterium]
ADDSVDTDVAIAGNAHLTGLGGVDLVARFENTTTLAKTNAQAIGAFGDVTSDAKNQSFIGSTVTTAAAATVAAGPRDPDNTRLAQDPAPQPLALFVDTNNVGMNVNAAATVEKDAAATGSPERTQSSCGQTPPFLRRAGRFGSPQTPPKGENLEFSGSLLRNRARSATHIR